MSGDPLERAKENLEVASEAIADASEELNQAAGSGGGIADLPGGTDGDAPVGDGIDTGGGGGPRGGGTTGD
jgi:hypothetical protein